MKSSFATQKIIIRRQENIEYHKKALEKSQKNVKELKEIIFEEEDSLKSFQKTLEVLCDECT